jgi:hypothetical protein
MVVGGGASASTLTATAAKPTQQVGNGAAAQSTDTAMVVDGGDTTSTKELQEAVPPASTIQGMTADFPESSEQGTKKTKGKPYCYRCRNKGHTIHECAVALCCELCYGDHTVKACLHSKKTNNNAVLYGYAAEGLGFYFIPKFQTPKIDAQDKRAVVRVLEGSFTVDQLAVELERLRPEKNHNWDIRTTGTGAFLITFPSIDLLERVVNWGPMDAKGVQGKICFEKGTDTDDYRREIEKVWVQFRGLPNELREFPIIWAIGTILGVPRAVDTAFTKVTGRARLRVAVLEPSLILDFVDVVIGDHIYELQFGVEKESITSEPQLIDLDSTRDDDPRKEDPNLGGLKEDDPKGGTPEEKMDVDGKNLMVRVVFSLQMASNLHMDLHSWKGKIHLPNLNQQ